MSKTNELKNNYIYIYIPIVILVYELSTNNNAIREPQMYTSVIFFFFIYIFKFILNTYVSNIVLIIYVARTA